VGGHGSRHAVTVQIYLAAIPVAVGLFLVVCRLFAFAFDEPTVVEQKRASWK
jgi:hypothetical protein